jgi:ABC-type branched-subunit amino acid transport system substrate-binding protein
MLLGTSALMFGAGALRNSLAQQATVVRFGQSASLSGGQAAYGKDVRDGIAAAFAAANRVEKQVRFELVALDDGGDKARCKNNVKTLIDQGVVAVVGMTSGAAAEACLPLFEEARTVMLGTASGNMGIRNAQATMAYHVRAGYDDEYRRMVSYVKEFGMQRVGYVYLEDTSPANQTAMKAALDHVGLKLTVSVPLSRNAKGFDEEVSKLLAARLDCVLFTTNASPISAIVQKMAEARYPGFYFSSSFAGQPLIDDMAGKGRSIIMSQVVPRPNNVAAAVVKRFQDDLLAYDKSAQAGFTSLEGYIAGRVAVEAARASLKGGAVTRARFRDALAELNIDLGGYRAHFGPGNTQGSRFVDVVAIDRSGRVIG